MRRLAAARARASTRCGRWPARWPDLRRRHRRARLGLPGGVRRRASCSATRARRTSGRSSASTRALASLAEIVAFVVLGLTVDLASVSRRRVADRPGARASLLAFVVRPLLRRAAAAAGAAAPRRAAVRAVGRAEGGGADPARRPGRGRSGVDRSAPPLPDRFVVVAVSVLVQGTTLEAAARGWACPWGPARERRISGRAQLRAALPRGRLAEGEAQPPAPRQGPAGAADGGLGGRGRVPRAVAAVRPRPDPGAARGGRRDARPEEARRYLSAQEYELVRAESRLLSIEEVVE